MNSVVNIAAYKFVTLNDLEPRRLALRDRCRELALKGTILLSPEGINLFLAGAREAIDALVNELRAQPEFADLETKESFSDRQPFNRMLVRLKQEIIAFGVDGIDPRVKTSRRLPAKELKAWLDEGRPVTLLDTRNDYEIDLGTFDNAVPIKLDEFRRFPDAIAELPEELKERPVVSFCTGGIRCEKAAPFLEKAGFKEVYQLEGGILKYFEECGGAHYQGDCFVFDQRVGLNPDLEETDAATCFACQAVLSREDRASELYVPGKSCPHCFKTEAESMASLLKERHTALRNLVAPLPGSQAYENRRPIKVTGRFHRRQLIDFLEALKTIHTREDWLTICSEGRLLLGDRKLTPDDVMNAGQILTLVSPKTVEPDVCARIEILHEDDAVVVLNKPAPLPMHPSGRFNRNTLQFFLDQIYAPIHVRPAHRLDANTSGIVICAKSRAFARKLQPQFQTCTVKKTYLARVQGAPKDDHFVCAAPISRCPTDIGARVIDPSGHLAQTEFKVVERSDDGTTLLKVTPLTGRTNQIRVHLWHLGIPVYGDPLYLPDGKTGDQQTLGPTDAPMKLHAAALEFRHPVSGKTMEFNTSPDW